MTQRRKNQIIYDESAIQMLDNIQFSHDNEFKGFIKHKELLYEDFNINSLPKALDISMERKSLKINRFLEKYCLELNNHLTQLYGFARSTNGLLTDEYREKIWPVLAKNIPKAEKLNSRNNSQFSASVRDEVINSEHEYEDYSDSDFESALSTFSDNTSLGSNDKRNERKKNYFEDFSDNDFEEVKNQSIKKLKLHRDWNQVEMDVNRTLARFPPNITDMERNSLQKDLTPLIVQVISSNTNFRYYQGFHDICLTLILVMGADKALKSALSLTRRSVFYNYLSYSLEETALTELQNIYVLLYLHDPILEEKLRLSDLGVMFALSWPLTWFSHDLKNYSQIVLFFDLFLSSHYLMPIYVSAAIIIERREELLDNEEADMPVLHHLLNHIPSNLNIERVLETAKNLFSSFPPSLVQGEYSKDYDRMCLRKRRQRIAVEKLKERIPKAGTIQRNKVLVGPWVVAGAAASAIALYLYVSHSYLMQNGLF